MKKLIALLLSLAMAASLAACGSSASVSTGTAAASKSAAASSGQSAAQSSGETKSDGELTPVTVQLKWVQQAQFMGYYAAKALGIYEDFGLDVTIVPGGSVDVVDEVDSGRAQFGDVWTSTAMSAIANGANVMSVAQWYQNSGMTLVSMKDTVADPTAVTSGEVEIGRAHV